MDYEFSLLPKAIPSDYMLLEIADINFTLCYLRHKLHLTLFSQRQTPPYIVITETKSTWPVITDTNSTLPCYHRHKLHLTLLSQTQNPPGLLSQIQTQSWLLSRIHVALRGFRVVLVPHSAQVHLHPA